MSFPPYTSLQVQPLDISVDGPFKKFVNSASEAWINSNPGKTMTIYDIPFIVRQILPITIRPENNKRGHHWQDYSWIFQIYLLIRDCCLLLWLIVHVKIISRKAQFLKSKLQTQVLNSRYSTSGFNAGLDVRKKWASYKTSWQQVFLKRRRK
jgi:hypothetical protein